MVIEVPSTLTPPFTVVLAVGSTYEEPPPPPPEFKIMPPGVAPSPTLRVLST